MFYSEKSICKDTVFFRSAFDKQYLCVYVQNINFGCIKHIFETFTWHREHKLHLLNSDVL